MSLHEKAIGVFDSGLGGISVLKELRNLMPKEHFIYFGDSSFAPYGEKSKKEITERCRHICEFFLTKGVKAIVIACNTATSACVKELRAAYSHIPIIGMEPALKVVADGLENQQILVMATTFTLKEQKFEQLMSRYSEQNTIWKQPCPKLVEIVESDQLDREDLVKEALSEYLQPYEDRSIDSIVLGCTHFVFYRNAMQSMVKEGIRIVDGNIGTARHVQDLLRQREALCHDSQTGSVQLYNSLKDESILELSEKLLNS